ncbi:hypothetical protein, partial [Sphingomonas sp.]|uniref:hypothetical protein n=1 Tax=Sphingomonas sp. TaxID=28214 RepID=UPI0035B3DBAB
MKIQLFRSCSAVALLVGAAAVADAQTTEPATQNDAQAGRNVAQDGSSSSSYDYNWNDQSSTEATQTVSDSGNDSSDNSTNVADSGNDSSDNSTNVADSGNDNSQTDNSTNV